MSSGRCMLPSLLILQFVPRRRLPAVPTAPWPPPLDFLANKPALGPSRRAVTAYEQYSYVDGRPRRLARLCLNPRKLRGCSRRCRSRRLLKPRGLSKTGDGRVEETNSLVLVPLRTTSCAPVLPAPYWDYLLAPLVADVWGGYGPRFECDGLSWLWSVE